MTQARLPSHLEIGAILRQAQADGGFATLLSKGEKDAGTILVLTTRRGTGYALWERMPSLDGPRLFTIIREQDIEKPSDIFEYIERRSAQDSDLWVIEVEIDDPAGFMANRVNRVDY